jgi:hypothetical protein
MRCYYVLVHGSLDWLPASSASDEIGAAKPAGFYCHRYVFAYNEAGAVSTAFRRVRANLDRNMGWFRDGSATVKLHADEVRAAPMHKLLKPDNPGHTIYIEA